MTATTVSVGMIRPEQMQRQDSWQRAMAELIYAASQQPGRNLDIRDATGAVVATLHAHEVPKRPKDMPRALRPKQKLSKRQRTQAKLAKLA